MSRTSTCPAAVTTCSAAPRVERLGYPAVAADERVRLHLSEDFEFIEMFNIQISKPVEEDPKAIVAQPAKSLDLPAPPAPVADPMSSVL